ncbi:MAG TPA: YbaK/EbsC family protein [Candidatus Sulfomarinibacteraceae bacterium]|nr:YbaK/EbsC family protein [Candidatus Sulfomarinibacteraceae bacterium]
MNEPERTPVADALTARNIPYRLFRHPGPIRSLEQAAEERGQKPQQVVRSLLFRLAEDEFVMVLVAGGQQVNWRALRQELGQSRLTMASREEVYEVTGYELGAVAPFGLPRPLPILVDESVLAAHEVSIGSGVRGVTVILRSADLMRALGDAAVVRVGEETASSR